MSGPPGDDTRARLQPVLDALRGAGTTDWYWDVDVDRIGGTASFAEQQLGYAPERQPRSQAEWDGLVHPDDLAAYRQAFVAHEQEGQPHYTPRYRMRAADGSWRWVDERGLIVERHPDGRARRVVGTLTDVTAQVAMQEVAARATQRLEGVARHVPGVLFQLRRTPGGHASFAYVSERCVPLLGIAPADLQRDAGLLMRKVDRAQRPGVWASIRESVDTLMPWKMQFCIWRDGEQRCLRGSATPQREDDGALTWHGYIEDVTDLLVLEQAQRDKAAAEAASRSKTEFLSHMSHELRTPLNAVLGFAQLLEIDRETPLQPGQRERVRLIREAGTHLLQMIGDLLDLTRIEAGQLRLQLGPVALPDLADDVRQMLQAGADQAGVSLLPVTPQGAARAALPRAQADRTRLRQVLINLVSNAIKYNRRGGRVELAVGSPAHGELCIAVVDNGLGVDEADLPRLFEPFFRGRQALGVADGAGIGLAATRAMVLAMGGRVEVRSRLGEGSRFSVHLPVAG